MVDAEKHSRATPPSPTLDPGRPRPKKSPHMCAIDDIEIVGGTGPKMKDPVISDGHVHLFLLVGIDRLPTLWYAG